MSGLSLPLLIAVQFLTRLPVRLQAMPSDQQLGRSLLWYPLVGLLIGALLVLLQWCLANTHSLLQAALLLAVWVAISGALHLDGLADCADAWVGGLGDRERTLSIMKDPRSGPVAVAVLVVVLLLKFAALVALIEAGHGMWLLLAPWIARCAMPLLFMTTPYVRANGLGAALAANLPGTMMTRVLLLNAAVLVLLFGAAGGVGLLVGAGVLLVLRRAMIRRIAGMTGDTAGAVLELIECGVLLALAI